MAINGISMGKMDWSAALDALNAIKGVKATKEGGNILIIHKDAKGNETSRTISIPELDDAEVFSAAELEGLIKNFDNLRSESPFPITETERQAFVNALNASFNKVLKDDPKTVDDVLGDGPKRGASKALFDVYGIFKLLILVAQLQRNALRDVRQSENASVQKAILDSAAEQRAAALAGLIGGLVVGGVQLCLQSFTLRSQAKDFLKQMEIRNASGVDAAKNNLNTSKLAGDKAAADKNLKQLGDKLGKDELGNKIREGIDESFKGIPGFDEIKELDGKFDKLGNEVKELDGKIDKNFKAARDEASKKESELNDLKGESKKLGSLEELEKKKADYSKQFDEINKKINEVDGQIDDCNKQVKDIDSQLEKLKGKPDEYEKISLEKKRDELTAKKDGLQRRLDGFDSVNQENGSAGKHQPGLMERLKECKDNFDKADAAIERKVELDGPEGKGGLIDKTAAELKDLQEKAGGEYDKLPEDQKALVDRRKELVGNQEKIGDERGKLQNEYCGKVDAVENGYKQKFETARTEYREALKSGDEAEIKDAKTKFENTQKEYEYAHAAALEAKVAACGEPSRPDLAGRSAITDTESVKIAQNDFMTDDAYVQLEQDRTELNVYESMIQSGGMAFQQMFQQISQLLMAKAHALGAKEQEARNELDQINDLFANCQKLLEAVLQAMMAVIQAESQSVDTTIQGIRG